MCVHTHPVISCRAHFQLSHTFTQSYVLVFLEESIEDFKTWIHVVFMSNLIYYTFFLLFQQQNTARTYFLQRKIKRNSESFQDSVAVVLYFAFALVPLEPMLLSHHVRPLSSSFLLVFWLFIISVGRSPALTNHSLLHCHLSCSQHSDSSIQ